MNQQMTPAAAHRVTHADFTIERVYDAAPARVYAAFADAETKQRWSFCHSDWPVEHALDFRPGGRETIRTGPPGGTVHLCAALYHARSEERRVGEELGRTVST